MANKEETVTLYYTQGGSDKLYRASVSNVLDGLYEVYFAYGRRGQTLSTGKKTTSPVSYDAAKKIYCKLVKEKVAKGYVYGLDGTPIENVDKVSTGIYPQLLNSIDEVELEKMLNNTTHCMQQKHDGVNLLVEHTAVGEVKGINKLGFTRVIPSAVTAELASEKLSFLVAGECVGDFYYVFDLLSIAGENLRPFSYAYRYDRLMDLYFEGNVTIVLTAWSPPEKRAMFKRLKEKNAEGVVFKDIHASYTAGRPNKGGPQLKFKFKATASCVVLHENDKRSVALAVMDCNRLVDVGNCTIPPNKEIPNVGEIVEIEYLYKYPDSGKIFQPVYLGVRDDVLPEECSLSQFKIKSD